MPLPIMPSPIKPTRICPSEVPIDPILRGRVWSDRRPRRKRRGTASADRHSGARVAVNPESIFQRPVFMDSGFMDSGFMDSGFMDSGFMDSGFMDSGLSALPSPGMTDARSAPAEAGALLNVRFERPKSHSLQQHRFLALHFAHQVGALSLIERRAQLRKLHLLLL